MPAIEFVLAPRQNAFFSELVEILRAELEGLGVDVRVSIGEPTPGDAVPVLVPPHEYAALTEGDLDDETLARTIFVCAEPPGSPWFESNVRLAPSAGAMFDINKASVEAFAAAGVEATHLPLGYAPSWDRFDPAASRPVDLCFLGCATERREHVLAGLAPTLASHRCELVISDNDAPNPESGSSFLAGEDKWSLLANSKTLLNVHREDYPPYFEWVRVLEAIHCGAVVVSEHSTHFAPLEPGVHFVAGRPDELGQLADELLRNPERLERMRADAYAHIRDHLPMRCSAELIALAAERIASAGSVPRRRLRPRSRLIRERRPRPLASVRARFRRPRSQPPKPPAALPAAPAAAEVISTTRAWTGARPRISVVVSDPVRTIEANTAFGGSYEVVIVESQTAPAAGAETWIGEHGSVPALLARVRGNPGPGATRNAALAHARGEFVLALEAGDELFPGGLERLVGALEADAEAAFAFGIVRCSSTRGPETINGYFGWEPERLARGDYIGSPALTRRSALDRVGGYSDAGPGAGTVDYGLWCAFAERGLRGAHIREFVGSRRAGPES